jgi:hypothetical protein
MSALAGTISSPWTASRGPGAAWWLRSLVSLLAALGILAVALPAAFGSGSGGRGEGLDPVQVLGTSSEGRLSIDGMVPGRSGSAIVRLFNVGSGTAAFSLTARIADRLGPGGAPLSGLPRRRTSTSPATPARPRK